MKQRITPDQLQELTPSQQEKLREWWQPQDGDMFLDGNETQGLFCEDCLLEYREKGLDMSDCLPLLSIGQCIQLLHVLSIKNNCTEFGQLKSEVWIKRNGDEYECGRYKYPELIDSLFEAVKSIL